jgi:hypothetical protein
MSTRSRLGTVTWQEPEFYISYDNVTGEICCVGMPLIGHPSFQISVEQAVKFTSGELLIADYRVIKENQQYQIVKNSNNTAVSRTYPVKVKNDSFPKIRVTRNCQLGVWKVSKITLDSVFIFVCEKKSQRHYIRTLNIFELAVEIPMIYTSEKDPVDLYVQEQYSTIEFKDE